MEIKKEDIYRIANDLNIKINEKQIKQVLQLYPIEAKEDKSAAWYLIIENLLYNLKTIKK